MRGRPGSPGRSCPPEGAGVGRGIGPCPAPAPAHQTPQWETEPGVRAGEGRSRRKSRGAGTTVRLGQGRRPPGQGRQCQESLGAARPPCDWRHGNRRDHDFTLNTDSVCSGPPRAGGQEGPGPTSSLGNGCAPSQAHPPAPRTSSIRTRGFSVLVFFRHWMILPGMAPTYVRLGKRARRGGGCPNTWASHTSA